MLKRLKIKNFQGHVDTDMVFSPGVNAVIGLSQSGKTAILRALLLQKTNRPQGARYYNRKAPSGGTCLIEGTYDPGGKVTLEKTITIGKEGKKKVTETKYELEGCKDPFISGNEVPDQILDAMNLGDINIQGQHDTPFLALSTPGEVAKVINRITKLERVDDFVSTLTTRINTGNADSKRLDKEIKELIKGLSRWDGLGKAERRFERAQSFQKKIDKLTEEEKKIQGIIEEIEEAEAKLKEEKDYSPILLKIQEAETLLGKHRELKALEDDIQFVVENLEGAEEELSEEKDYPRILKDIDEAESMIVRIKELETLEKDFSNLLEWSNELGLMGKAIDGLREQYGQMMLDESICPTCFRIVDEADKEKIVGKL